MLFNTLGYAQFLAVVFTAAWLLVDRRHALLLPWLGVLLYAGSHPSLESGALALASGLVSVGLVGTARRMPSGTTAPPSEAPVPARLLVLSLALNLTALGFLTVRAEWLDPVSYGLSVLGVPTRKLGAMSWLFFAVGVTAAYFALAARSVRLLLLLGASYVFYAHWDYRFLPLIWASSTIDWWLGRRIHRTADPRTRRLWLVATVILNLGVLGFFKYFDFGVDSARAALSSFGVSVPDLALHIALPVGISFFTFESMSYVIDVYRRELEPQESYFEYLTFVAFFPHLVAGPIVRPKDLLPQLSGRAKWSDRDGSEGLFLVGLGLAKKIVIGDYLALNLVDRVFDAPLMYSALENYAAIVGYALQIYCDFSGYTDIAIGSALLLGVRFPLNFDSPYKARSVVEFWRRWHISLSTWLRDYLYVPLGGNRRGPARTYLNLLLTMVLGGLWHGAAWTFVAWGTLHGVALAVNKWWSERSPKSEAPLSSKSRGADVVRVILTFHFVCFTWVFFRAASFDEASLVLSRLATLTTYHPNLSLGVVAVLGLGLVTHFVPDRLFAAVRERLMTLPFPVQGLLLFMLCVLLRKMASADAVPFVYFQF